MKQFLTQLKELTRLLSGAHESGERILHPARDWHLLLVVTLLLFMGLSAYSISIFYRSGDEVALTTATSTRTTILKQEDLRSALELYRERLTVLETLRRDPGTIPSPGTPPEVVSDENGLETPAFD